MNLNVHFGKYNNMRFLKKVEARTNWDSKHFYLPVNGRIYFIYSQTGIVQQIWVVPLNSFNFFFQWFPPLGSQLWMIPSSVLLIKWSRKILRFPHPQAINNDWSLKPFPFLVVLYGCQVFHFSLPLYLRTERCSEDNLGLRSALIRCTVTFRSCYVTAKKDRAVQ